MDLYLSLLGGPKVRYARLVFLIIWLSCIVFVTGCGGEQTTRLDGLRVPEGFTIERAVSSDSISYPMFATFDLHGRLFVFESTETNTMGTDTMLENPSYHIRLLEDTDGDGQFDKNYIYADKISFPMGGVFYDGSLYVTASPDLLKLTDTNGDGRADKRETLLSGWTLNANGAILSGPFMGPDGWLYMAGARRGYSIETKEGDSLKGKGARIWRTKPDGSDLEWVSAGGFDNSIEIAFMPSGETIGTMTYFTDPQNGQRDALMHWVEGGVYPKYHPVIEEDDLPLTGDLMPVMTKFPRIAPSGLMRYQGSAWGEKYRGNLFSAIFNTGEIMRHVTKREGATYVTEDKPFISSEEPNIHPTDVLEDADGSMLVVVTGGWFIEGCPLSRVAKPNIKGGIYRIRKQEAVEKEDDPWGKSIDFDDLTTERLTALFSDDRPMVQKKAVEELVQRGASSIPGLEKLLSSTNEEVRTAAIFALYRIQGEKALQLILSGLNDKSTLVQTASARVAGLTGDERFSEKLEKLLLTGPPSVQRQAATALGQIGDKSAVEPLLNAVPEADDRFVEHAIIYSLIELKHSSPLIEALNDPSVDRRKAAVVALDQMNPSPLTQNHLLPFLSSREEELRDVGIWVASHRPGWTNTIVNFVKKAMQSDKFTNNDRNTESFRELMITFCYSESLQHFMGDKLTEHDMTDQTKLLLLDVMSRCNIPNFPSFWITKLGDELGSGSDEVRSAILKLIEMRRIEGLNQSVERIIYHPEESAEIRLKALGARIETQPQLSDRAFKIVVNYLRKDNEAPVRQSAVRLLSRAELNKQQLLQIARKQLRQADLFMVPSLLETFQDNQSEEVGLALIGELERSPEILDNISQQNVQNLINTYPESVQSAAAPLMTDIRERQSKRLAELKEMEEQLVSGNVGEGRELFFGKATCSTCHTVGNEGASFGPDLTNIGEIRSRHDLLEAIVFPDASFAREYETYQVTTVSTTYSGIITEQLPQSVLLSVGPGQEIRIPREKVTSIEPQTVSLMPPGLHQQLSVKELSDLLAFLEALPYRLDRMLETEGG